MLISGHGSKKVDWRDLKQNTVYSGGFHSEHRLVKWFWQIMEELSPDDCEKFLMFTTSWRAFHPFLTALNPQHLTQLIKFDACFGFCLQWKLSQSSRPPLLGFSTLNPKFALMCTGGQLDALPTASTCMNKTAKLSAQIGARG